MDFIESSEEIKQEAPTKKAKNKKNKKKKALKGNENNKESKNQQSDGTLSKDSHEDINNKNEEGKKIVLTQDQPFTLNIIKPKEDICLQTEENAEIEKVLKQIAELTVELKKAKNNSLENSVKILHI